LFYPKSDICIITVCGYKMTLTVAKMRAEMDVAKIKPALLIAKAQRKTRCRSDTADGFGPLLCGGWDIDGAVVD
jgi:hypothetical protein